MKKKKDSSDNKKVCENTVRVSLYRKGVLSLT